MKKEKTFEQVGFTDLSYDQAHRIFEQTSFYPNRIIICKLDGKTATRRPYVFASRMMSWNNALEDMQTAKKVIVKTPPR